MPPEYYMSSRTQQGLADGAERVWREAARRGKLGDGGARLTVLSSAPEHIGLGSKTSLAMATAYALGNLLLADRDPKGGARLLSHDEVRRFSGRGGTSRIGVLACEFGGIIFEDGHPVLPEETPTYLPSSRRTPSDDPIPSKVIHLPDSFRIALFMDPDAPRIEGDEEASIFQQSMPFDCPEVLEAIAAERAMKAAFDRLDLSALTKAMRNASGLAFKRKEVDRQTDATKSWLSNCWDNGCPVGVSSFGPITYGIATVDSDAILGMEDFAQHAGLQPLGVHRFNNAATKVEWRLGWQDALADMIRHPAMDQVRAFNDRARDRY